MIKVKDLDFNGIGGKAIVTFYLENSDAVTVRMYELKALTGGHKDKIIKRSVQDGAYYLKADRYLGFIFEEIN